MSPNVGQPAPDFQQHDTSKNLVSLSGQKGKIVVLLFFPAAFTSVCTSELCHFRDALNRYQDLNAQVYGISVDMPYSLKEFGKQQALNFPLLSDFNKEAILAYDISYPAFSGWMSGVAKRASFVVDTEGIIRFAEVLENAGEHPDYEGIAKTVEELNARATETA